MNIKKVLSFDKILILIQIVFSLFMMYLTKKILPMKYWLVISLVLIVFVALILFLMKSETKTVRHLISRIVSLIISIVLVFGSVVAYRSFNVLNNITGGKYQTQLFSVAVERFSSYNELTDLEGKTVGIVSKLDSQKTSQAQEDIAKQVNVTFLEYYSIDELQNALMNNQVDAIVFNEAYRGLIEENNSDFETETRIIYQYQIKEEVQAINSGSTKNVTKDAFNVYISGIDTYGPVSTVSRSDVNMIMTVNPSTKQILLTSIPRDYYVELGNIGALDKLTHSGIYGISETIATAEKLLDINIDYYARVNFSSLVNIVDALGGIDVYSDLTFVPHTNKNITIYEGNNHMNGEMALAYARERYSYQEGDRHRVRNQQDVLTGILNKLMSSAVITNYNDILSVVSDSVEMSFSSKEVQSLIQMQLNDMAGWNIEQISLDGYGDTSTTCYSAPGQALYVMQPDISTVETAKSKINEVSSK